MTIVSRPYSTKTIAICRDLVKFLTEYPSEEKNLSNRECLDKYSSLVTQKPEKSPLDLVLAFFHNPTLQAKKVSLGNGHVSLALFPTFYFDI